MGDELRCTFENCKTLRMKRSSIYTPPIVFVRGKGSPLISRDRSCTRSEQSSAVSTFERVHCIDLSHDNFSHPNLASNLIQRQVRTEVHVSLRSCEIQLSISSVSTKSRFSSSSKCSSHLRGMRGPITCFVTREGRTSFY